jgi:hypothetical protein
MDLRFEDRATPGRSRKAGAPASQSDTTKGMPTLLAKFTLFVVEVGAEEAVGDLALERGLRQPLGQLLNQPTLASQSEVVGLGTADQIVDQPPSTAFACCGSTALTVSTSVTLSLVIDASPLIRSYTERFTVLLQRDRQGLLPCHSRSPCPDRVDSSDGKEQTEANGEQKRQRATPPEPRFLRRTSCQTRSRMRSETAPSRWVFAAGLRVGQ